MSIYSLARKFELKLAIATDYSEFKNKALTELQSNIAEMASLVKRSKEMREAAFTISKDPLIQLGENAQQGVKDLNKIISGILYLDNNTQSLTLEEIIKPILSIAAAVYDLAGSQGSDKWGISRDKFLNVLEIYGDYYTSQGGYGEASRLNPMAKREMEIKFGSLTNTLDSLANLLRNTRQTGALDILKGLSRHGLVESDSLERLLNKAPKIGDTTRVVRKLENHEKEQIFLLFDKFLGISQLNLMPNIHTWNKYVEPATEALLSDVFRSYLRSPTADKRELQKGEVVGPNNKILSQTTIHKLNTAAKAIADNKKVKDGLISERVYEKPPILSPIKPQKNIRQEIESLDSGERALWNKIPIAVQIKVLNNQIDLGSALEVAERSIGQMTGAKLDATLFDGLG